MSAKSADETLPSTYFLVGQRFRQNEHHCRLAFRRIFIDFPGKVIGAAGILPF
jgi:hypothetical protein